MYKVAQNIREIVPGLDGWRIHELKTLGLEAWTQRARIVEIQLRAVKAPANYKQVSTPGTYGEPVQSDRGMGQGCCLSLIAANATVAIEFRVLQH